MIFPELTEVLDPDPHDPALNMAIDEVLLRRAAAPLLRVYRWSRPAVSFGCFGKFSEVERSWPGREAVRRWTGGGIVPHGDDVTYTLIAPRACEFFRITPLESYARIHEAVVEALGLAPAGVRLAAEAEPKISEACFENPVRFDVLAEGRKIAGAAQRRARPGLLHQGSIQARGMQEGVGQRLGAAMGARLFHRALEETEIREAETLAREKYSCEEWLKKL